MSKKMRLLALTAALVLLLPACVTGERTPDAQPDSGALTWSAWSGYENFLELAASVYPDIELELTPYAGANRTGYSWVQMQRDDIPDIFITSQILDGELASERLADLSCYDFVNNFSTAILDQVAIDGGVYLLPVNNTMYGIYYNKTLMEEHGWQVPSSFAGLEALCAEIREAGLIPGVIGTQLTGNTFSALFNLAKTSWLTTPDGVTWERDFLAGSTTAAGRWETTMDYFQRYIDIGMFTPDPEDRNNKELIQDYLGGRKAVFFTAALAVNYARFSDTGDQLGMMPYISENGGKNIYMYSPSSYIGISKRLTEPGNEKKLEEALSLLSLLYSSEGQAAFLTDEAPCVLSVLDSAAIPEDALIYDAQQALREGRAFQMTYAGWEGVLADIGQGVKEWVRGENGMDGPRCAARMDELQRGYLSDHENVYFCESTADFTVEETACLVGKALGSAAGADAAIIPYTTVRKEGFDLKAGVTARLYQGRINTEVANTIAPGVSGEYAIMTMTGTQAKELAEAGFDAAGDGQPFPYVLVVRGDGQLEDGKTYQVAFLQDSCTAAAAQAFQARVEKGSISAFLRDWLEKQKTVSPGGNPWE
ncbi:ABC transporter substrate-binding protein [Flintibacter muris]|uniref:ABC transporter substrate-binding protein n=1 Tax=Flintibacter muris TaxID=2941327 RepID=UPI00203AE340|nr:ABC transporter substrate-binding protein [Flintibacter muris]